MSKKKEKKCTMKCLVCQHYDKKLDYCTEKKIEDCSKVASRTDFSTCEDYLVRENLVMF